MAYLLGCDVSHHNKFNTFGSYDFVIIKATEGTTFVDKMCETYVNLARDEGKLIGLYHFLSATSDAKEQAKHFIEQVENVGMLGEAILVLDYEAKALKKGSKFAKQFLDEVYRLTKVRPIIYMSASVVTEQDWKDVAPYYGLWVASYGSNKGAFHKLNKNISPWKCFALYQYTSNPFDKDVANMSAKAWSKYAKGDRKK